MTTAQLIDELEHLVEKHKDDKYSTFETRWIDVVRTVLDKLKELSWHIGTPTEEGLYIIAYRFGDKIEHEVREMYYSPMYGMTFGIKKDIVKWQKIEP